MSTDSHSQSDSVDEVVAEYLRAIENGENPSRDQLLAKHPDLADELQEFFADHDRMNRLAQPLCEATLASPAIAAAERIRYFGDYEVLEEIARGGMGVVFKARQVTLNRIVAIKMILSGHLASPADVERFHTEAEAAAKLDHPGIVPIYEVGQHDGQHYFSMGFVDGISLSAKVAQGPLPAREAAELVRTVAEAVQYAHDKGVIHRDLKPGNILLDHYGNPRVTDFGLAKLTESVSDLTGTGQILGTPGYMPPEQAAGQVNAVGRLSDVYSLGAILYCLLTGRPPFQAATPLETLLQVQNQEPVSPRQLNPSIPLDLDTIVLKSLEKSPARRYLTAHEVADELGRFLEGRPIVARRIGQSERFWRWCRRTPVVAGLAALLLVSLVSGTAISTLFGWRAAREASAAKSHAEFAGRETKRANLKAAEASDLATKESTARQFAVDQEAIAKAAAAESLRVQKEYEQVVGGLDEARAQLQAVNASLDRGKVELHRTTTRLSGSSLISNRPIDAIRQLDSLPTDAQTWESRLYRRWARPLLADYPLGICAGFSPDGRWLAIVDNHAAVRIEEFATGKVIYRVQLPMSPRRVAFSPKADYVAFVSEFGGQLYLWHPVSGRLEAFAEGDALAFVEDGSRIVTVSPKDKSVSTWHLLDEGLPRLLDTFKLPGVGACAISPNAALAAWVDPSGSITVVRLETRESSGLNAAEPGIDGQKTLGSWANLCFSPDGLRLAASRTWNGRGPQIGRQTNSQLVIWDVTGVVVTRDVLLENSQIDGAIFSPDGTSLACATASIHYPSNPGIKPVCGVHIWSVRNGELSRLLPWHSKKVVNLAFSPDGRWLASAAAIDGLKVWDLSPVTMPTILVREERAVYSVAISGDASLIASCINGPQTHNVRLWSVDSGTEIAELVGNRNCVRLEFSPDDRFLASAGENVAVWNLDSRQSVFRLEGKSDCVAFSSDGKQLAVTRESRIEIYDLDTGSLLSAYAGGQFGVAFHPGGNRLASSGAGHTLWDLTTAQKVWEFAERGAYRIAFSPENDFVAFGHGMDNGKVCLRNTNTGELVSTWSTGRGSEFVLDLCFCSGGSLLAAVGIGEVGLWDPASGQKMHVLTHPDISTQESEPGTYDRPYAVAFSRDGRRAVAGWGHNKGYGSVTVWDTEIGPKSVNYGWLARPGRLDPPFPKKAPNAAAPTEQPATSPSTDTKQ